MLARMVRDICHEAASSPWRITRAQSFSPKPKCSLQYAGMIRYHRRKESTDGVVASTLVIIFSKKKKPKAVIQTAGHLQRSKSIGHKVQPSTHLRSLLGATRNSGARIGDSRSGGSIHSLEITGEVIRQVNEQRGGLGILVAHHPLAILLHSGLCIGNQLTNSK